MANMIRVAAVKGEPLNGGMLAYSPKANGPLYGYGVYCLCDPRSRECFYIGKTHSFINRAKMHAHAGTCGGAVDARKQSIWNSAGRVLFITLERSVGERAEERWIREMNNAGHPLLNSRWPTTQKHFYPPNTCWHI